MDTSRSTDQQISKLDIGGESSIYPKYEQLKHHLISEMIAGRLKPGQAMPSEQQMVAQSGLARMTVRQAMAALESDGLIRRVQRRGSFVQSDVRRKLKRGQDIFALVVPETREGFYPSLLHGFDDAAAKIHHRTIVCRTDDDPGTQGEIVLQLLDQKVGGIALNPTAPRPTPAFHVRQLQEHGIPVVLCHRGVDGINAPLLAIPFHRLGRLAGRTFVEHGHRRVAFIAAQPPATPMVEKYEEGLREALQVVPGCWVETAYVEERPMERREESCLAALQQMFARPDPPTGIFASFDSLAEMIYLLLLRMGRRVPEDVSLMGFGGAWREGALTRRITSVVVDEVATGRKAVELLHEMRRGDRPIDNNEEFVMDLDVSNGETLARPAPLKRSAS